MIKNIINNHINHIEHNNFKGWDPYDALNSPLLKFLSFNNKWGRIFWIQIIRRLPFNLRKILLIPKGHNPKGLGLFLEGYVKLYRSTKKEKYIYQIEQLLQLLEDNVSQGYSGNCWGYNFPWQSRAVYRPRYTPTVVNTSFIGHALLDCYKFTGIKKAKKLADTIPCFIIEDLNRKKENGTICFSYSPIDHDFVHNANMLGASYLLRYGKISDNTEMINLAHKSLQYSINHQHDDGSWYFAEGSNYQWIDSFHTGFKLESIRRFIELDEGDKYIENYKIGKKFYQKNFFLEDGTPKYYYNKIYPIDSHVPSEAIYFFSGECDQKSAEIVNKVLSWSVDNLWDDENHYFYFRKNRFLTNKINYIRWSQAWFFRALTEAFLHQKGY